MGELPGNRWEGWETAGVLQAQGTAAGGECRERLGPQGQEEAGLGGWSAGPKGWELCVGAWGPKAEPSMGDGNGTNSKIFTEHVVCTQGWGTDQGNGVTDTIPTNKQI